MPYPSGTTMARILERVRFHFEDVRQYQERSIGDAFLFDLANECLNDINGKCFTKPDQMSFSAVADDWNYALAGASVPSGVTDRIDEVLRVDYDGTPINRYLGTAQIVTPDSSDASGTPTKWWIYWDGGVPYLGLKPAPDDTKTITLFVARFEDPLTATTDAVPLSLGFEHVLTHGLISMLYMELKLKQQGNAWRNEEFLPRLEALKDHVAHLLGERPRQRRIYSADDLLE